MDKVVSNIPGIIALLSTFGLLLSLIVLSKKKERRSRQIQYRMVPHREDQPNNRWGEWLYGNKQFWTRNNLGACTVSFFQTTWVLVSISFRGRWYIFTPKSSSAHNEYRGSCCMDSYCHISHVLLRKVMYHIVVSRLASFFFQEPPPPT